MHSPTLALLWERWQRVKAFVPYVYGLPLLLILVGAAGAGVSPTFFPILGFTMPLMLLVWLFALFTRPSSGGTHLRDVGVAFPRHDYRLPVSSARLAAIHLSFVALGCFTYLALMLGGIVHLLGAPYPDFIFVTLLFAAEATAVILMGLAVAWLLAPIHTILGVAGAIATWFGTQHAIIWCTLARQAKNPVKPDPFSWENWGPYLVVLIAAYLLGWAAVALERHGFWQAPLERLGRLALLIPKRTKPFRSPFHAQVWFEFRRIGWVLPVFVAVALAGVALILRGPSYTAGIANDESFGFLLWLVSVTLIMGPAACLMAGLWRLAVWYREMSGPGGAFLYTRPVSTRTLAMARLRSWAYSAALAAVLLAALYMTAKTGIGWRNDGRLDSFGQGIDQVTVNIPPGIMGPAFIVLVALAATWILYANAGLTALLLPLFVIVVAGSDVMLAGSHPGASPIYDQVQATVSVIYAVLLAIAVVPLAALAVRWKTLPTMGLVAAVLTALAGGTAMALLLYYADYRKPSDYLPLYHFSLPLLVGAACVLPLVAVPVAMEVQRHRRT